MSLVFGVVLASTGFAFPFVDDLVILQNHFYVGAILLLALGAPHVRHSRRFPSHVTSSCFETGDYQIPARISSL